MKNRFKIILIVFSVTFAFVACSKITLKNSDSSEQSSSIVGIWSLIHLHEIMVDVNTNKTISDTAVDIVTDGVNSYILIQFDKSGNCISKTDFDFDTMSGDPTDVDIENGTYILTKDSITITENGESTSAAYSISGDRLTMTSVQTGTQDGKNVRLTTIATYKKQ